MNKKTVILILSLLSILAMVGSFYYYDTINSYEDPRVIPARKMIDQFERLKVSATKEELLAILDKISAHYQNTSGYQDSYELAVFDNDRAAIYVHSAFYKTTDAKVKNAYLKKAEGFSLKALERYHKWKRVYGALSEHELTSRVSTWLVGEHFIERRVEMLQDAQLEIDRRLSVAYTNFGIIQRHQGRLEAALEAYKKAIELWDQNQAAENNLRIIVGKKPLNPSFLRKMFPPERLKK